ncbi:MAG: hypothetical protein JWL61_4539 [Gemmatimonadetes bacterium]|nr:hypothetical protein [Gemmatimonadota bacterium]
MKTPHSRSRVGVLAIIAFCAIVACSGERKASVAAKVNGPLVALMTQHASATCGRSDRTYATIFFHPPYQTCTTANDDSTESAEIDSDSVVVELTNTWKAAPADQATVFSQAEGDLTSRFGMPQRCSATKVEWRQGDSLDVVLQIAPVSQVGTEFNEGPYRMTRVARLGAIDPSIGGC